MRIVRKNRSFSKKNFSEREEIWDFIVDNGIATDDEVRLVIDINGYSESSLNDIIYARTGFHSVEQYKEDQGMEDFACGSKGKKKFADEELIYDSFEAAMKKAPKGYIIKAVWDDPEDEADDHPYIYSDDWHWAAFKNTDTSFVNRKIADNATQEMAQYIAEQLEENVEGYDSDNESDLPWFVPWMYDDNWHWMSADELHSYINGLVPELQKVINEEEED